MARYYWTLRRHRYEDHVEEAFERMKFNWLGKKDIGSLDDFRKTVTRLDKEGFVEPKMFYGLAGYDVTMPVDPVTLYEMEDLRLSTPTIITICNYSNWDLDAVWEYANREYSPLQSEGILCQTHFWEFTNYLVVSVKFLQIPT